VGKRGVVGGSRADWGVSMGLEGEGCFLLFSSSSSSLSSPPPPLPSIPTHFPPTHPTNPIQNPNTTKLLSYSHPHSLPTSQPPNLTTSQPHYRNVNVLYVHVIVNIRSSLFRIYTFAESSCFHCRHQTFPLFI